VLVYDGQHPGRALWLLPPHRCLTDNMRNHSLRFQEKLAQAGSFLVFNPDKFAVNKKKQGLRLNIKPLVGVLGAVVAAAAAVLLQQQQQQQQQQQPKAKGGCR
jgi:hypothetical protein